MCPNEDVAAIEDADLAVLVGLVADGHPLAFNVFYGLVAPRVRAVARGVVKDSGVVEEVTQEALLQVWLGAKNYSVELGTVENWVTVITRRRAIDRVRSQRVVDAGENRLRNLGGNISGNEPEEEAQRRDEHVRVRSGLATLTALQREAVLLAYYANHSYRDVARILAVPEGTAKARLRDGLQRLRTYVESDPRAD